MVKWHSKINLQKHEWMSCKKSYYQGYLWWWDFSAGKLWYGIVYGAIGRRYLGKILRSTNVGWFVSSDLLLHVSQVRFLSTSFKTFEFTSSWISVTCFENKFSRRDRVFFSWVVLVANSELPWCFMSWQLVSLSVIIFTLEQARKRRLNISLK